jgi:hypothetical protein
MLHSRRSFLTLGVAAGTLASGVVERREAWAQVRTPPRARAIDTPVLNIGFEESGAVQGFPIILLHGFPDDVRALRGTTWRRRSRARGTGSSFRTSVGAAPHVFVNRPPLAWQSRQR